MSTAAHKLPFITPAEYLAGEELADVRHEYILGRVQAMSGASDRHNEIALDVASAIKAGIKGGSCRTYLLDMKVEVTLEEGSCFYYPDVFVTCSEADAGSPRVKRDPVLVIEILSPSTWRVDAGEKLRNYTRVPSMSEVILIAQEWSEVILHRRSNQWRPESYTKPSDRIALESIGMEIALSEVYASVSFREGDARPWYMHATE